MESNLLTHNELDANLPTRFEYVKFASNSFCVKILTSMCLLVLQLPLYSSNFHVMNSFKKQKKTLFLFFLLFCLYFPSIFEGVELDQKKKMRFFCLDFHGSVSADVKDVLEELGHEVVIWMMPGSAYSRWTLGINQDPVKQVSFDAWINGKKGLDLYDNFYERYKDFLMQFDGFIAPFNASLALFYRKSNKPIIVINANRYEIPFSNKIGLWGKLNYFLRDGVRKKRIFIVANNKADKEYLSYYTGLKSIFIPSLCRYTKAHYTGKNDSFILHLNRKKLADDIKNPFPDLISDSLKTPYQWQDLYDYRGIIHFPYQISTMSIFEQYTANVPLFLPSKEFLIQLQKINSRILGEVSYIRVSKRQHLTQIGDLNNLSDPKVIQFWIDHADFYDQENMPHIQYFDSIKHLRVLLENANLDEISKKMAIHNEKRKKRVLIKWQNLLNKISHRIASPNE